MMFSTRVLLVVTGEKEKSAPTSRKFKYLKKLSCGVPSVSVSKRLIEQSWMAGVRLISLYTDY